MKGIVHSVIPRVISGLVLLVSLAGCAFVSGGGSSGPKPAWILNPKSDDSVYMYRVGHASGHTSSDSARDSAYRDALAQISKSIVSSVVVDGSGERLSSKLQIKGAEVMPGCVHEERENGLYACWVQVSYPLIERNALVQKIDKGERLNKAWGEARSEMSAGSLEKAVKILSGVVAECEEAMYLRFEPEEAKLLLGDLLFEQKDFLESRRWYETVETTTNDEMWKKQAVSRLLKLPRSPRFWAMNDRFAGRKVGLFCCVREDVKGEKSSDLAEILSTDCREARLESVDVSSGIDKKTVQSVFDGGDFSDVIAAAEKGKAGVVIAVLIDIDSAKREKNKSEGEGKFTPDTTVKFTVLDIPGRSVVYNGYFKEMAGNFNDLRLAQHAASVLIENYLVPKCPRIAGDKDR